MHSNMFSMHLLNTNIRCTQSHPAKGKEFFPKVFQRCTEMIDSVIYNQEAVVIVGTFTNFDWRILVVVSFDVQC